MELSALLRDRSFLFGLAVRIALLVGVTPAAHLLTVMPALDGAAHGLATNFAYGLPTLLLSLIGYAAGSLVGFASIGFGLTVLAADIGIFLLLSRSGSPERRDEVARLYWLSPLIMWLFYASGSLAALTGLLMVAGFVAIERRAYGRAGLAIGLAAACQPVLLFLIGPIGLVYALGLTRLRAGAGRLLALATGALLLLIVVPALLWPGFLGSVIGAPEMMGLVAVQLPAGGELGIALLPLIVVAIGYLAWRARIIDRDILWALVTLVLLAALGAGDPSPGLMVLAILFLCSHAAYAERSGHALHMALSVVLFATLLLFEPGPVITGFHDGTPLAAALDPTVASWVRRLMMTIVAATVLVAWLQVFQRGLLRNATYLATRRPLALGIAGDSGVGKDTLADAVGALFNPRTVAKVSGDDYHKWDRNKPMWRALTHLNPKANDLELFNRHVTELADRRWVRARHYDHATGRMTKPLLIRPGEIVLASGLHALSSPTVNARYDLRIFLDMDEDLRRYFKIRRDVNVRGHPLQRVIASLERRHGDAQRFIHSQKDDADLIFRLEPRQPELLSTLDRADVPMRLAVEAVPGIAFERVVATLVSICGIQAIELPRPSGASRLLVEGEPSVEDIAAAARRLAPGMRDLLNDEPGWEGGLSGVLQLITLDQMEQIRVRRSVNA